MDKVKSQMSGVRSVGQWKLNTGASRLQGTVTRLLRDETAVTYTEYVIAALAVALGAIAASRAIAGVLVRYLHRIYLVVTLPIP